MSAPEDYGDPAEDEAARAAWEDTLPAASWVDRTRYRMRNEKGFSGSGESIVALAIALDELEALRADIAYMTEAPEKDVADVARLQLKRSDERMSRP